MSETGTRRAQSNVSSRTLLIGDGPSAELGLRFFVPTVVYNLPPDALTMTEETFGPAMGILAADGVDELLVHANALPYGLAAYVYTGDLERGWASPAGSRPAESG